MPTPATALFRNLPQLGELLKGESFRDLQTMHNRTRVLEALRAELDTVREELRSESHSEATLAQRLQGMPASVAHRLHAASAPSLRRVINATGVILQTNLGRAPLSAEAIARVAEVASGYSNLEFDLQAGERGKRDMHAERLILEVLASRSNAPQVSRNKSAAVVNNCAAATFLALNTLAEGGEVIVSRGELVEIGGGFRVPDILRKSGASLCEVGTTNRTRIRDYAEAITPATRLILRVHRSNFRIDGFTEQPALQELIDLGKQSSLPVFEDQGTGSLTDLDSLGIPDESSWLTSAATDLPLVACSGDKLLGGPQSGILVGDREHIERIRKNPLYRALRVDKMTYASLEATLQAYLQGREHTLPAIAMMRLSAEDIRTRCEALAESIGSATLFAEIVATESVIGGGTTPGAVLPSFAVALRHTTLPEEQVAAMLRAFDLPVVARTHKGSILLDLRTVAPADDALLQQLLSSTFTSNPTTQSTAHNEA